MTLHYRNGRYEIDIYIDGRQIKKGGRIQRRLPPGITQAQAEQIHGDFLGLCATRRKAQVCLGLTVSKLTEEYLKWYALHRAPATLKDARRTFEGPIDRLIGGASAEHIGPVHIQEYQVRRKADGVSNRTINKEVHYFCGCLKWAGKNGYISARTWRPDLLPYSRPIPQVLSADEARRLIVAADPFYRPLFILLYAVGLRMNEARTLRWEDIDRASNTLTVKQKGGTFKRLPFPPILLSSLEEIVQPGANLSGPIFIRPRGKRARPIPAEERKPVFDIRKALARAAEGAGITKRIYPHLLRHSFATVLMGDGVNIRIIQQMLGHKSQAATAFYTTVSTSHMEQASRLISASLEMPKTQGRSLRSELKRKHKQHVTVGG